MPLSYMKLGLSMKTPPIALFAIAITAAAVAEPTAKPDSIAIKTNAIAKTRVTMMSFNIRMGGGLEGPIKIPKGKLGHLPACADVIRKANPDWVAVQEINRRTKSAGYMDQTAELARLCGMHGTFVRKVGRKEGDYGLAILSREAPISVDKILVPGLRHPRCVEILEFADYFVACTHFPLSAERRLYAAEVVLLNLTDRKKPVFLAGDFNATPDAPEIAELEKGFTILSDTSQPTYRADDPTKCIDFIFVDKAHAKHVTVHDRQVIAAPEATDHCAVVVVADVVSQTRKTTDSHQ